MPNSSTFITTKKILSYSKYKNKEKVKDKVHFEKIINDVCFAIMNKQSKINYVIIEKEKQIFPKEMITEYLDDLMKIEQLLIESYSFRESGDLYIKIKPALNDEGKITFHDDYIFVLTVTFIRYLYEGGYGLRNRVHDEFYHAINCYFRLKKLKLGNNILQRLLIATNYIFIKSSEPINTNHLPCNQSGCNIFFDITKKNCLENGLNNSISNSYKHGYLSIYRNSPYESLSIKYQIKKIPDLLVNDDLINFVEECANYTISFDEKYEKLKKELDDKREKRNELRRLSL